eukprot:tig00021108_g18311.t1
MERKRHGESAPPQQESKAPAPREGQAPREGERPKARGMMASATQEIRDTYNQAKSSMSDAMGMGAMPEKKEAKGSETYWGAIRRGVNEAMDVMEDVATGATEPVGIMGAFDSVAAAPECFNKPGNEWTGDDFKKALAFNISTPELGRIPLPEGVDASRFRSELGDEFFDRLAKPKERKLDYGEADLTG